MNAENVKKFRSYVTCAARWGHVAWAKYYEGDEEMCAAYASAYHVMEEEARALWLDDMFRPGHDVVCPENWGLVWWLALRGAAAREGLLMTALQSAAKNRQGRG